MLPLTVGWGVYFLLRSRPLPGAVAGNNATADGVPVTGSAPSQEPRDAKAITRFLARSFDLLMWGYANGLLVYFVIKPSFPEFAPLIAAHPVIVAVALPIAALPVSLALDALCYGLFGNTPGKAFLRITVQNGDSVRLTPGAYAWRNVALWCSGLGFNIPVVGLLAMFMNWRSLRRKGRTHYDADLGFPVEVKERPVSVLRWVAFAATAVAMNGVFQSEFVKPLTQQLVSHAVVNSMDAWLNPVSNRPSAPMPGWELQSDEAGKGAWLWRRPDNGARLYVAYVPVAGPLTQTLESIAKNLRTTADGVWKLTGQGGSFMEVDRAVWEGERSLDGTELQDTSGSQLPDDPYVHGRQRALVHRLSGAGCCG
ncbi:RDD family protein [Paraburkholderia hospita]|uniref:RDD family protein n=1 Tax=Paraburkholderia hospita TaxID=169430 RepID=UPI00241875AF|nr:RDD family protein [Paraburkholderia hospita]